MGRNKQATVQTAPTPTPDTAPRISAPAPFNWMQAGVMAVAGLISVIFLTNVFLTNPYQTGVPGKFEDFEKGADAGTFMTVEENLEKGLFANCGLVKMTNGKVYTSHCGFNALLPGLIIRVTGQPMSEFVPFYYKVTSFMLALGLTLFMLVLVREFGWGVGVLFLLLMPCGDWIVYAGRNASYLFYLYVLPFFASWVLFPRVLAGRMKAWAFLAVIGALVFIKSAAGYEFITNVILGATVAPVYYGISRQRPWKETFKVMGKVVAVGILGFFLAVTVNLFQNAGYYKSFSTGFQAIAQKASARTLGGKNSTFEGTGGNDSAPAEIRITQILHGYMTLPGASLPFGDRQPRIYLTLFTFISASLLIGLMALVDRRIFPAFGRHSGKLVAFAAALFWSLACAFSWPLVAKGFMFHHFHIASMAFYAPYMLMLFAGFGLLITLVFRQIVYFVKNGYKPGALTETPS